MVANCLNSKKYTKWSSLLQYLFPFIRCKPIRTIELVNEAFHQELVEELFKGFKTTEKIMCFILLGVVLWVQIDLITLQIYIQIII